MTAPYDSTADTLAHIDRVQHYVGFFLADLAYRSSIHDQSKLVEPEKSGFDIATPRLRELAYGSDEYNASLADLQETLAHHYAANDHHPEHHPRGVAGMNLFSIVEMFCDWMAAVERHANGDIKQSIVINQQRFGYSDELRDILFNTVDYLQTI